MVPQHYYKNELAELIEQLKAGNLLAVERCIDFFLAETRGLWHGRARAKICRNLKNLPLDKRTKDRLVATIVRRLETGNFSEQFKDQLTMAIRFRPCWLHDSATQLLGSPKGYVQRYASWVLNKINASEACDEVAAANKAVNRSCRSR